MEVHIPLTAHMALFEGHCERFWLSGPTPSSGPSKEQIYLIDPRSPDFFHLIPSTLKIWLKLESRLSFLCSDSWILICHPVLFSPLSLFSLENLPCPWPDTSSCPQILLTKEPVPLARCLYATTCVVISIGGFLFSSGVSTSLEQILQAQFDIIPNYTRVCLGMRSN